ncbi:hypothetical protein WJ96_06980 [Burkholderia ubonensis]|uniref:Uncharacterized protein n=1 Tax=Burkholderia ubonensis TaxID=101571 RepID=A0AAW3MTP2_9BURK|nr:hypothetical protein [Burkholderia ubonensis]KVP75446.1 hypothetical protein WJ93_08775 [Burkholderia ubonensis]KVP98259.1 hypothetical protein WJ96_06980 [Burkholderia ubonensis]KVZ92957.1 hypothetical protein WL25_18640 [Burkholderia ubonensis]
MAYRINRDDDKRISIQLDGQEAFVLEREDNGRGIWALFPVRDGVRGAKIDRDQYSNDLIERVTGGLILAGHVARVAAGYVVPVPVGAGDFYVSSMGYLCCRAPVRMVLTEAPVTAYGIEARHQIRPATVAERQEAGLDVSDATRSAVFLEP